MRPMMGGRGGGRGGGPTPNQELMEMREAIIHCNGSPEMLRNLAGLLAHDLPSLTEPATALHARTQPPAPLRARHICGRA